MLTNKHSLMRIFSVVMAAAILSCCDRIQNLTSKIKTTQETTAKAASAVAASRPDPVKSIDSTNFTEFTSQKNKLVIVDFYADWCGPCRMMGPALEKAVAAHPGAVCLGKVNVDQAKQLAAEHKVGGIPDVRFFKDGKQVRQFVGFPGEDEVLKQVAAFSKGIVPVATPPADGSPTKPDAPSEPKIQRMKKDWLPPGLEKRSGATN